MSAELAELRTMISDIQKTTAATAEAVSWIKAGMANDKSELEKHMEYDDLRLDRHEKRISKVERRQAWFSGASAVVGTVFGAAAQHLFFRGQG
jgi:hypothetical protein